ncbi:MAG: hypothetical protein HYR60_11860, partial [Acidobacteria bacterium]|nr:hypothetical protein [Acidobacteriota bacterium]
MTDRQAIRNGLLVGVAVGALICVGHLYWQLNRIGNYVLALQSLISERALQPQAAPSGPAAGERKAAAAKPEALESLRTQLQGEMSATRAQAAQAAQRAKAEALTQAVTHADSLARALGDRSQSQHQEITGELGQVKQTTATVSARIADVSTDLATIRSQMAAARLDLEHTLADLKRVRGDLGVQSGLIATNARELAALR